MDFSFTEEQSLLQDSVQRFVQNSYEFETRQKLIKTEEGFSRDNWSSFAELGWLALPFSEDSGGFGGTAVETMIMMEEFGKGLVVEPYVTTVIMTGSIIEAGGSIAHREGVLAEIMAGTKLGSVAYVEPQARFNLADVTTIITTEGETVVFTYLILFYGFLFSILLTGMLEGFMFTYAILKNEILGIDEQLRKTFSAAIFATLGGIIFVMSSEIIEGLVPGGGLMAGFVVGIPLVILRKPIFGAIQNFSSVLMPEAFTKEEMSYIEAYSMVMDDGILTENERKLLSLQAKNLGLDDSRIEYLEAWYAESLGSSEEE